MRSTPEVTSGNLRDLLCSPAENPVLYLDPDTGQLDIWAGAYVPNAAVIVSRADLEDWIGTDWADDDSEECLNELQDHIDHIAEEQS